MVLSCFPSFRRTTTPFSPTLDSIWQPCYTLAVVPYQGRGLKQTNKQTNIVDEYYAHPNSGRPPRKGATAILISEQVAVRVLHGGLFGSFLRQPDTARGCEAQLLRILEDVPLQRLHLAIDGV